jgi:hypothetical protein
VRRRCLRRPARPRPWPLAPLRARRERKIVAIRLTRRERRVLARRGKLTLRVTVRLAGATDARRLVVTSA